MNIIKKGIYVGYSEAPNNGECFDNGKIEMFSYEDSALIEGAKTENIIGWEMTPEELYILFEIAEGTKIEKVSVNSCVISKEDANVWGSSQITLTYCENETDRFYTLGRIYPNKDGGLYEFEVKKSVRFIKLQVKRNPWRAYPLPQIMFSGEESQVYDNLIPIRKEKMIELFKSESVTVDEFGQATFLEWECKIHNDEQLFTNGIRDLEYLKKESVYFEQYDKYGGILNYKKSKATGFFRVEKIDGIWWFITPEGNPFIMKGVDLVTYSELSYHTPIYVSQTNVVRGAFEKLPDKDKFSCAYGTERGIAVLNFLKANLMRKYGADFDTKWVKVTKKRLNDWGFNAASKWDKHSDICMPYIYSLSSVGIPFKKVKWLIDPYDKNFAENVDLSVKDILPTMKNDPYLIGYHYTNEAGFDRELFKFMLQETEECAMKKAFLDYLCRKVSIQKINEIFNTVDKSIEELLTSKLSITNLPEEFINEFIIATAKIYYKVIHDCIKKYDPNHLYMGGAFTPEWRSTYVWNVGALEYLDVLSFDYYVNSADKWIEKYAELDVPIINIEFSFTASDRGMGPIFPQIHCDSQTDRGIEYKKFLEYNFSIPQFVGSGFFILYDQPLSGRCDNILGKPGECYNFGLIDITDEPYSDFIKYVKQTHEKLENIHANEKIL